MQTIMLLHLESSTSHIKNIPIGLFFCDFRKRKLSRICPPQRRRWTWIQYRRPQRRQNEITCTDSYMHQAWHLSCSSCATLNVYCPCKIYRTFYVQTFLTKTLHCILWLCCNECLDVNVELDCFNVEHGTNVCFKSFTGMYHWPSGLCRTEHQDREHSTLYLDVCLRGFPVPSCSQGCHMHILHGPMTAFWQLIVQAIFLK